MRITFVTNIPTPNQNDFFAELAAREDVDLMVLYSAMSESNRQWRWDAADFRYPVEFLWRMPAPKALHRKHLNPGILLHPRLADSDVVVIGGWSFPTVLLAALVKAVRGGSWLYWVENFRFRASAPLLSRIKRTFLQAASGVLCVDERSIQSSHAAGVPDDRICRFPYVSDSRQIAAQTVALRSGDDAEQFKGEGMSFLFVGQLIPRKGLDVALRALGRVAADGHDVSLTVVGNGPDRAALEALAAEQHELRVEFVGFVEPPSLPQYYARADVSLVPSRYDGWGLVVNEALAAGLPVITTTSVGAADLLDAGRNGFVIPPGEVKPMEEVVRSLVTGEVDLGMLKHHAQASGVALNVKRQTDTFLDFATHIIQQDSGQSA